MSKPVLPPIVGRPIGRREEKLDFGEYPISVKMGPTYLRACSGTAHAIRSGKVLDADLASLSEMKGMYNRLLRQDRPDWEAVRHLLGKPDRAVCHLAANWLTEVRRLAKSGQSMNEHLGKAVARGIEFAAMRARTTLERAGFRLSGEIAMRASPGQTRYMPT